MKNFSFLSGSREETVRFGARLSRHLKPGDIVCLFGELGSGKTTLVKGLAKGLRIPTERVHSPTFTLLNVYAGKQDLFHFDFYRLNNVAQIAGIGYDEFLYGKGVSVIEWAERFGRLLPKEYLGIELSHKGPQERRLKMSAHGKRYQEILLSFVQLKRLK